MRRVLLISFQYPPMTGTSGIQRALRFSQYLPEFGWEPIVLTANPGAYERTSEDQMGEIPSRMPIGRAFALDCARHLAVFGRYPKALALPDRWTSWHYWAVPEGMRLIRQYRPSAIWSTFPIPTAHRVAGSLHARTGLPWVADFRDVMTEEGYPADEKTFAAWREIEERVIGSCARAVFTTRGAADLYADRYSNRPRNAFRVIENGYDESVFARAESENQGLDEVARRTTIELLHSGVVYPSERDPTQLFVALAELRAEGYLSADILRIRFRASGHDDFLAGLIDLHDLKSIVELAPPISYSEAIREMLRADALLLLQAHNCSRQVPAKVYEYLRAGRPILGLADGDTEATLRESGIEHVAPLESKESIKALLLRFIDLMRKGECRGSNIHAIEKQSRRHKALELTALLNEVLQ